MTQIYDLRLQCLHLIPYSVYFPYVIHFLSDINYNFELFNFSYEEPRPIQLVFNPQYNLTFFHSIIVENNKVLTIRHGDKQFQVVE